VSIKVKMLQFAIDDRFCYNAQEGCFATDFDAQAHCIKIIAKTGLTL